jgi:hypothetical protein
MTKSSLSLNKKNLTTNVTEPGDDGPPSAPNQASTLTPSSLEYQKPKKSSSFEPSSPFTESLQEAFLASIRAPWFLRLPKMLQATWLRRFRVISNKAPFTSKEAPSYSPPCNPS